MSDRTKIQRNKGDTSTVTNPSLASSTTPTLANPIHSLGLQSTTALPETSSNQQDTQFSNEQLPEGEVFKQQPQGHDISRISLRPQAKLSTSQLGDTEPNWLADRKGGIIPKVLQRKCAACEEEEELQRRIDSPIIQRDETSGLPPVPNYQLTPPSLLQPPDPATQYGLGLDLHLQLDPQLQAMQHVQQQLNPATIRSALNQINLGVLPTQGVTSPGTPNSTTPTPNPFASPTSPPAASPVPAGAGPDTPQAATAGDLVQAIIAVPAIDGALTSLQTQVGDRISQDWGKLRMGEQIGVVSSLVIIGGGALAGAISDPTARRFALDQLNGRMLPVPGLNWLHLEMNTGGDNLMLGMHVDVGRLLPPSFGFGSSSPSAIGSPPQPEPLPGMIQRQEDNTEVGAGEAIAQRIQAASGGGNNLHEGVQQHLEQHLGADLSGVRIHTDGEADRLSRSVNAVAFTTGQDIFFSAGSYNPSSAEGKHLIAHEVVHTVQQANGAVAGNDSGNGVSISDPADRFEVEAEQIADRVMSLPDPDGNSELTSNTAIPSAIDTASTMMLKRLGLSSIDTTTTYPIATNSESKLSVENFPHVYLRATVNTIQRDKNENSDANQQDLIKKAIESKDPGDVKKINPFRFNLASVEDRFKLLDVLLNHNSFIGPYDASAIEKIWSSFGKDLGKVASEHFEIWKQCNSHKLVDLEAIPELVGMKIAFKQAVVAKAKDYLNTNKKLASDEIERLGLNNLNTQATTEQTNNLDLIKEIVEKVNKAQEASFKLGELYIGYKTGDQDSSGGTATKEKAKFVPGSKPEYPPEGNEDPPMPTYEETQKKYEDSQSIIDGFASANPSIFALVRDGKISEANAIGSDRTKLRQSIEKPLKDTLENIGKTEVLLNNPSSDLPLELEPIHKDLYEVSPWNLQFQKSIAKKCVEEHDNTKFWNTIGVGSLQLALFVVGSIATGGLATFFLGAAAISGAAQAGEAWQKFSEYKTAGETNLSKKTALISQEKVGGAFADAILATVFAFLDIYGAGKALGTEIKGLKASKLISAEAQEAKALAEATEVAEKSSGKLRNELKVEKTATGETHEFKFFKDGTIRRCSDPPCNFLIDSFKARADKGLGELATDSPLRQQAESLSNEASAIQKEYSDLVKKVEKLPEAEREAQLAAGEAPIRQRLEKVERSMADLEIQVGAGVAKSFPKTVSYGKNYLEKFRKHAEQIRRTTGNKGIGKVSSAEGQAQIKAVIEDIVMSGETRQQRYMSVPDALWSQKGNAIVIRQANGEFITFLEAGKGAAQ